MEINNNDEYYNSTTWKKKRSARLAIDKHECRLCGCKENLEVHHKQTSYDVRFGGDESVEDDLTTLCKDCHKLYTNLARSKRYETREIVVAEYKITKIERIENGNKNFEIENEWKKSLDVTQWAIGKSDEPSC